MNQTEIAARTAVLKIDSVDFLVRDRAAPGTSFHFRSAHCVLLCSALKTTEYSESPNGSDGRLPTFLFNSWAEPAPGAPITGS
jgi:hypothetical protein